MGRAGVEKPFEGGQARAQQSDDDGPSLPNQRSVSEEDQTTWVPVHCLVPADSIRKKGEDADHIQLLARTEAVLPPILVHKPTMRVIDGMHRLRAAISRGDETIAVNYFDGSELEAFVHAVRANVTHGLPLSRADREAAVVRLLRSEVPWSDRAIADIAGLSAPTVGAIRQQVTGAPAGMGPRVGRDGRTRPLNPADGRRKASAVILSRPDASLREIAKEAGISVGTARDVRERLRRGDDPVPTRFADKDAAPERASAGPGLDADALATRRMTPVDPMSALQNLRRDPSLRFTEVGRSLLQWLSIHTLRAERRAHFAQSIPEHCRDSVAELAIGCARIWEDLARELNQHGRNTA
jgi:ParB-like chromosome segregation protein Spo0J